MQTITAYKVGAIVFESEIEAATFELKQAIELELSEITISLDSIIASKPVMELMADYYKDYLKNT